MDPLGFLFSLERLGIKFGLENMRVLCAALGHPERAFPSVIVAGTNGKGSVTAMVSTALHAAGHRVGRYTSPHLQRLEERFVIDEQEVGTGELGEAAAAVQETVEQLVLDGRLDAPPTFFECATAIAFELFRRQGVAIALLEVGLGGRLDATNIVSPTAAAITSIDFDHQALLGHSLEEIATEKAGIIKPGIPVVCGPLPAEADRVMVETCAARGAELIRALDRVAVQTRAVGRDAVVSLRWPEGVLTNIRLGLPGRHQVANAAVALCLMEEVSRRGFELSTAARQTGLTRVRWPGRLEHRLWHGTEVLLDAAHNPAGARALARYLEETGWSGTTLVFGAMHDKDVGGMLAPLLVHAARVICTTAASPRALPADDLAALARRVSDGRPRIQSISDPAAALSAACAEAKHVVVAGSIFLVGPLRGILR